MRIFVWLIPSQENLAEVSGGGIFVSGVDTVNNEPVSIKGGFFDGNGTPGRGGGIFARGKNGTTTLFVRSRFGGNIATSGVGEDVFNEDYSADTVITLPLV